MSGCQDWGPGSHLLKVYSMLGEWEAHSELKNRAPGTGRLCDQLVMDKLSEKCSGGKVH